MNFHVLTKRVKFSIENEMKGCQLFKNNKCMYLIILSILRLYRCNMFELYLRRKYCDLYIFIYCHFILFCYDFTSNEDVDEIYRQRSCLTVFIFLFC